VTLSHIPKDRTIDALDAVWTSTRGLLESIGDDAWSTPTALAGWDVKANVSHMIGTEAMLLGEPDPDVEIDREARPHVRNDIGAFNEVWVEALAATPPADVLATFVEFTDRRIELLRSMTQADWDAESFTPAGRDTYGRFMQIRVFDCWFHEQDVREALGRPGHEAGVAIEVTLDEVETALGFVVGKRAGAPQGTVVTFELTGPSGRVVHVEVAERARVVESPSEPSTVTISVPVVPFTRLCGGRTTVATVGDLVQVRGDDELGHKIVENLSYTI
jgi:uncharacterized protein (TIGR03083 family)